MCVSRLVLLLGLLLCVGAQLSNAQHWSHGWYPGGKRELDSFGTPEVRTQCLCVPVCNVWSFTEHFLQRMEIFVISLLFSHISTVSQISEEIKLCEAGECSYLRPQRRSFLRNIIVSQKQRLTIPCLMSFHSSANNSCLMPHSNTN